MKKSLLLTALSISIGIIQTQALDYDKAPATEMASWVGKYITLHGNGGPTINNNNRYLFDRDGTNDLSAQTDHNGTANYWYVEAADSYGGIYLKNAVTDRYIGTLHINDKSWTGMTEDKANAGIFLAYIYAENPKSYVLTSTKVRTDGNKNNPTSGTLGNNSRVCHEDGATKGYASFNNDGNDSKVWLFCTTASTGIVNVSAFGNPNGNSHWVIDSYDEEHVVNEAALYAVRQRFPDAAEQDVTDLANRIVAELDGSLTTFSQKYAAINAAANAYPYALVDKTTLMSGYITIKGAGTANMDRYMFNDDVQTNLMAQRNYAELNKYWIAEANDAAESLGGVYLKNAITGKYIGQIYTTNSHTIPMVADKASAGEVMIYHKGGSTYISTSYVIDAKGNSIVNPLIETTPGLLKGYAKEHNVDDQRLWMVCVDTHTDDNPYNVINYGTGNINSHWTVETNSDAEVINSVLTAAATTNAKKNFPDMTDEEISAWVENVVSDLDPTQSVSAKHTAVLEITRYIARQLDGKRIRISTDLHANTYIALSSNNVKVVANPSDEATYTWNVEYDAEEDGMILSIGEQFLGRMPAGVDSENVVQLTADKTAAGRYRFYRIEGTKLGLTCTRTVDGELIATIGQEGGKSTQGGNFWLNGNVATGETSLTRWGSYAGNSKWNYTLAGDVMTEAEQEVSVNIAMRDSKVVFTLTHADGLSKHDADYYQPEHIITITKSTTTSQESAEVSTLAGEEPFATITHENITATEDNALTFEIDIPNEDGVYIANMPSGMFKVGQNQYSKASTSNFQVKDGVAAGIKEIIAEAAGHVIYDLQGRRLAAPAKGINIINGRKVLVK